MRRKRKRKEGGYRRSRGREGGKKVDTREVEEEKEERRWIQEK